MVSLPGCNNVFPRRGPAGDYLLQTPASLLRTRNRRDVPPGSTFKQIMPGGPAEGRQLTQVTSLGSIR
jgi:hypothetical protein